eukprot:6515385-Pyramimonas_sp.AAC.1
MTASCDAAVAHALEVCASGQVDLMQAVALAKRIKRDAAAKVDQSGTDELRQLKSWTAEWVHNGVTDNMFECNDLPPLVKHPVVLNPLPNALTMDFRMLHPTADSVQTAISISAAAKQSNPASA